MYAVIKTGGKQYKVAPGNLLAVDKLAGEAGDVIAFENVVLLGGDSDTTVGSPLVAGASVAGEIVEQARTAKILVFKKRRRKNSKRSRGHRQDQTLIRITEILTDGKKPAAKKATAAKPAKPGAEETAEAAPTTESATEAKPAKPKRATAKASESEATTAAEAPRSPRKTETDKTGEEGAKPARKPRAKPSKAEE